MSQFIAESSKGFSVERMDRFMWSIIDEQQPMILLVETSFFMAFILLAPAVVEAVSRAYRNLCRKQEHGTRSTHESLRERDRAR